MSDLTAPREEVEFLISTEEFGKRNFRIVDKLSIDDIVIHLTKREIFRVLTGVDEGVEVPLEFQDPLILDDYMVR